MRFARSQVRIAPHQCGLPFYFFWRASVIGHPLLHGRTAGHFFFLFSDENKKFSGQTKMCEEKILNGNHWKMSDSCVPIDFVTRFSIAKTLSHTIDSLWISNSEFSNRIFFSCCWKFVSFFFFLSNGVSMTSWTRNNHNKKKWNWTLTSFVSNSRKLLLGAKQTVNTQNNNWRSGTAKKNKRMFQYKNPWRPPPPPKTQKDRTNWEWTNSPFVYKKS